MEIESASLFDSNFIDTQNDSQYSDSDYQQEQTFDTKSENSDTAINLYSNEEDTAEVAKERRKNQQLVAGVKILYDNMKLKENNSFHVFGDLCISNNYQIKLGGASAWSSLGFDCLLGEQVIKYENFVDLKLRFNNIQKMPIETMINELSMIPHNYYQQFAQGLIKYNKFIQSMQANKHIQSFYQSEEYEKGYISFSKYCLDQVKELSTKYSLYSYCIGRTNYLNGSFDVSHIGYSNDFLELICLDYDMIQQMVLRDRKFQLITDIETMLEQSLLSLLNRIQFVQKFTTRMKITTLDGYEIWINQIYHKMKIPPSQGNTSLYFFCFCELDIDLDQLKGLLDYRQSIYANKLNYENFIKKELSYYSEDVEYSILSQSFLERFYKNTYNQMMNQKKIEENQEVIHPQKVCGFRRIN